jgi:hypothetical protein
MLGKLLKTLHEIGAIGTMGSFAACIVLLATAPATSPVAYAAVLQGIASITQRLLVPSLAIVLISGLLAIAANDAYKSAAWAWAKALLGIGTFEGALLTVGASAPRWRLPAMATRSSWREYYIPNGAGFGYCRHSRSPTSYWRCGDLDCIGVARADEPPWSSTRVIDRSGSSTGTDRKCWGSRAPLRTPLPLEVVTFLYEASGCLKLTPTVRIV